MKLREQHPPITKKNKLRLKLYLARQQQKKKKEKIVYHAKSASMTQQDRIIKRLV